MNPKCNGGAEWANGTSVISETDWKMTRHIPLAATIQRFSQKPSHEQSKPPHE